MKPSTQVPVFTPGFRVSVRDAVVVIIAVIASVALFKAFPVASLVIAMAAGHFFMFCNVFRIARKLELIWAGIFIALAGTTIATGFPGWLITLLITFCVTVVVVICDMRKPYYHGVGWRKINPELKTWWDAKNASEH